MRPRKEGREPRRDCRCARRPWRAASRRPRAFSCPVSVGLSSVRQTLLCLLCPTDSPLSPLSDRLSSVSSVGQSLLCLLCRTESPLSDTVLRRPRRRRRRACGIVAATRLQPWRAANSRPRAFSNPRPAQPVGFRRRSSGGRTGGMGAAGAARRARDRDGPDPLLRALSGRLFLRQALRGGADDIRGWSIRGWSIGSM